MKKTIWFYQDLKETLKQELDFVNEGRNGERCADELKHLSYVYVPEIHWDFTTKVNLFSDNSCSVYGRLWLCSPPVGGGGVLPRILGRGVPRRFLNPNLI